MLRTRFSVLTVVVSLLLPGLMVAKQPATQENSAGAKIIDEGMNRSQAMATIRYLSDVIGPRLTNSPGQRRANKWTKEQLEKWGLKNAAVDPWGEFGRGWELKRFNASVATPDEYMAFRAFPKAWSPSTNGPITGNVVFVDATDEAGLEKYKGKLKGAMVLVAPERPVKPGFDPAAARQTDKQLTEMETDKGGAPQGQQFQMTPEQRAAMMFSARKTRFYYEEGAAVLVEPSQGVDSGTIRVTGASLPPVAGQMGGPGGGGQGAMRVYSKGAPTPLPQIVAEVEQYNRLYRLAKQDVAMRMTVDIDARFHDDDLKGYNTIAEIPGTDLKDEVVMIGAHLDSWHAGTGTTDNGAGVTVVMEAMRILAAAGLQPRRTIRVALWTGEEQGLLGSRHYVARHFASQENGDPIGGFGGGGGQQKIVKKPGYDKFAAYYNLDNGTGQIRGIYMQGNEAVRPVFKSWLSPYSAWGATTTTIRNTSGTDHLAFDAVGLPGFQFIQDPVEYQSRTWHTTQDVFDRAIEEDLKRSAVIMATFAYNSAMTEEKLARKASSTNLVAALIGGFDPAVLRDESSFHRSGLEHLICGHPLDPSEIPVEFPSLFTIGQRWYGYGE